MAPTTLERGSQARPQEVGLPKYNVLEQSQRVVEDYEDRIENAQRKPEFMEDPWGAFGQVMFVKEFDGPNGGKIKKIAAVSMPLPPGTATNMGKQILSEALALSNPDFNVWNGVHEGKMLGVKKDIHADTFDFGAIRRLSRASAAVIGDRHQQKDHASVQNFFVEHESREQKISVLERDAQKILSTPDFLHMNAFNPDYKGVHGYVLEYLVDEEGNMWGVNPKGEQTLLANVFDDQPHKEWGEWLISAAKTPGNSEIGHFNNTERVSDCGGSTGRDGCSRFYKAMQELPDEELEKALFTTSSFPDMDHIGLHLTTEKESRCKEGHASSKCDCNAVAEESDATE